MKEQHLPRTNYMLWLGLIGLVFGLVGAVVATVISIMAAQQPFTLQNAIQAHMTNPLLWFFDLFPFVMLVLLGLIGWHQDQLQRLRYSSAVNLRQAAADIEHQKARIVELERRKVQLDEIEQESIQTEEKISRAKRQWEATFDSVRDMIILTNTNRSIIRCNRAVTEAFNLDYSQIIGCSITEFVPAARTISPPALGGGPVAFLSKTAEARLPGLDGRYEIFANRLEIAGDWAGEIFIIRDVSDRQQALLNLQLQKQYYESLVKNNPIAIVTLKMDHTVVECNPAFENLFGHREKDIIGKELGAIIAPPDRQTEMRRYSERVAEGELLHELITLQHRDGSPLEVEMFSIPVISRGKQIGIFALYHDISELARSHAQNKEETLRIQKLNAEARSKIDQALKTAAEMSAAATATNAFLPEDETELVEQGSGERERQPQQNIPAFVESPIAALNEIPPELQAGGEPATASGEEPAVADEDDFKDKPEPVPPTIETEPEIEPLTVAGLAAAVKAFAGASALRETHVEETAPASQVYQVEKIEGIGRVYAGKLSDVGIHTTADLLEAGASREGRQELAERSGISEKLILGWVNRADLMQLPGVGEELSDLLELAGVDTVEELRQRNPESLHQDILSVSEQRKAVRRVPSLAEVTGWIEIAQQTPAVVTY